MENKKMQELQKKISRVSAKVLHTFLIDINDIIFNEMNGYIPSFVTMSLDEMAMEITDIEDVKKFDFKLANNFLNYLLEIEKHYDKKTYTEIIETYEKDYKKLVLEKNYIGFHVVYFECQEPLCSVTTDDLEDAKKEFEEMKEQM